MQRVMNLATATRARTRCAQLRALLKDERWHNQQELVDACGFRFGAVVFELRRGDDGGPPLLIETRRESDDSAKWSYRQVGVASSAAPPAETLREQVKRLQRENQALRYELLLEQRRGRTGGAA